jgi:dTDP-4-dehydrorhamnose reductase
MKLLVFGQSGQVATELARRMPADVTAVFLGRDSADLSRPTACAAAIAAHPADAVINAAAWTAVDKAEAEETAATLANGVAPAAMARACAARGLPLLHISTDYVFDGLGDAPFAPDHPTAPENAYGRSKLAGEAGIRASGARHLILRTSWVVSAHGANFVKTMLRLGCERDALRVVADQIGAPTPAAAIADALVIAARAIVQGAPGGTLHFAGSRDTSWAGFARAIMASAHLPCRIEDIASVEYPTPARRPLNSRLDCAGFTQAFGIARPDWQAGLDNIVKELTA